MFSIFAHFTFLVFQHLSILEKISDMFTSFSCTVALRMRKNVFSTCFADNPSVQWGFFKRNNCSRVIVLTIVLGGFNAASFSSKAFVSATIFRLKASVLSRCHGSCFAGIVIVFGILAINVSSSSLVGLGFSHVGWSGISC